MCFNNFSDGMEFSSRAPIINGTVMNSQTEFYNTAKGFVGDGSGPYSNYSHTKTYWSNGTTSNSEWIRGGRSGTFTIIDYFKNEAPDATFNEVYNAYFYSSNEPNPSNDGITLSEAGTMIGTFGIANGVKGELINLAAKSGNVPTNYVKVVKGAGVVGAVASASISTYSAYSYYNNGGTSAEVGIKASIDVTMAFVALIPGVGLPISASYFILDAAGFFGDFGEASNP
ncbi:MAG: hypothetical protein R2764_23080 [Bacteroidales bacterium]